MANELAAFAILAIMAMGLNISFGMAGIVDIGYVTFVALGAYVGGVTALGPPNAAEQLNYILGLHLPWPLPLIAGAIAAAVLGLIIGLVAARRLRSDYQAIVMVATWSIAIDIVGHSDSLFNGQIGLYNVPQPFANSVSATSYVWIFVLLALTFTGALSLAGLALERSAFGRTLRAIRDEPDLAAALGKNTLAYRLKAMVIATSFAGVAGALFVEYLSAWNTSGWSIFEVVGILAAIIMGGRGRVLGVVFGAFVVRAIFAGITFTPNIANRPELTADVRDILMAVLFLLVLLLRPNGFLAERIGAHAAMPGQANKNDLLA
jgi:branched-chain amino acid transport system permease protein